MSAAAYFLNGTDIAYWVSGTSYASGNVARSPTDHQRYVRVVAGAGTTDPANDATNWRPDGGRAIKSIQRGTITIADMGGLSGTATVSAVNTAKACLHHLGSNSTAASPGAIFRIALTNATTVTATRSTQIGENNVSWELVEYY